MESRRARQDAGRQRGRAEEREGGGKGVTEEEERTVFDRKELVSPV